jgi:hypothetical protein
VAAAAAAVGRVVVVVVVSAANRFGLLFVLDSPVTISYMPTTAKRARRTPTMAFDPSRRRRRRRDTSDAVV